VAACPPAPSAAYRSSGRTQVFRSGSHRYPGAHLPASVHGLPSSSSLVDIPVHAVGPPKPETAATATARAAFRSRGARARLAGLGLLPSDAISATVRDRPISRHRRIMESSTLEVSISNSSVLAREDWREVLSRVLLEDCPRQRASLECLSPGWNSPRAVCLGQSPTAQPCSHHAQWKAALADRRDVHSRPLVCCR
jgi:hypothetical protein